MLLGACLLKPLKQLRRQRCFQAIRPTAINTDTIALCTLSLRAIALEDLVREFVFVKRVGEKQPTKSRAHDKNWQGFVLLSSGIAERRRTLIRADERRSRVC